MASSKSWTYLFAFLIAIGCCGIIYFFIIYRQLSKNPEKLLAVVPKGVDVAIEKIHQASIKDGMKEWVLDADSVQYIETTKQALLKNIVATFYLKNGKEIYLKANEGILQTDTKNIEVKGNVIVISHDLRLETEKVNYYHERRLLSSETPVKMMGEQMDLTANSMTVDLNSNQTTFQGNVKGIIRETIQNDK